MALHLRTTTHALLYSWFLPLRARSYLAHEALVVRRGFAEGIYPQEGAQKRLDRLVRGWQVLVDGRLRENKRVGWLDGGNGAKGVEAMRTWLESGLDALARGKG